MRAVALLPLLLMTLLVPPVAAQIPSAADWEDVASQGFVMGGRKIQLTVRQRVDSAAREAAWLLGACLVEQGFPSTCMSQMTEAEALPAGSDVPGRSFILRARPEARIAWVLSSQWSGSGIDLKAYQLDLRALTSAMVTTDADGKPEVHIPPEYPLMPGSIAHWSARDPQPQPACVPLSIDVMPGESTLDIDVRPAAASCVGWRLRHDTTSGAWLANPLEGFAAPDIRADFEAAFAQVRAMAAKTPPESAATTVEAAATAATKDERAAPPRRARPALTSFSRR